MSPFVLDAAEPIVRRATPESFHSDSALSGGAKDRRSWQGRRERGVLGTRATAKCPEWGNDAARDGRGSPDYSHSMVPGGFEVMSSTTRLTSRSSLIMREAIVSSRS